MNEQIRAAIIENMKEMTLKKKAVNSFNNILRRSDTSSDILFEDIIDTAKDFNDSDDSERSSSQIVSDDKPDKYDELMIGFKGNMPYNESDFQKASRSFPFIQLYGMLTRIAEHSPLGEFVDITVSAYCLSGVFELSKRTPTPAEMRNYMNIVDVEKPGAFAEKCDFIYEERLRLLKENTSQFTSEPVFWFTILFEKYDERPSFESVKTFLKNIESFIQTSTICFKKLLNLYSVDFDINGLNMEKPDTIFSYNADSVMFHGFNRMKVSNVRITLEDLWGKDETQKYSGDQFESVQGNVPVWLSEIIQRMKRDAVYDWKIVGIKADFEESYNNVQNADLIIRINSIKNDVKNTSKELFVHFENILNKMTVSSRLAMKEDVKREMSIFFLFPENVGLPKSPVRSNLEKQDYHREYLKFGNKILLRVVEEETMREFRNSEAAKFPETSSSYWLKDRIDDVMTSVTWQNVQKEIDELQNE